MAKQQLKKTEARAEPMQRAEELLKTMTVEEKAMQLSSLGVEPTRRGETKESQNVELNHGYEKTKQQETVKGHMTIDSRSTSRTTAG